MRFFKTALVAILALSLAILSFDASVQYAYADNEADEDTSIITGIVKENNPSLGYLTLYFQDGSGANPNSFNHLVTLRNYTYGFAVPVLRDGIVAAPEDIKPGDQVFLKLDLYGDIAILSARSRYNPVYGTVHMKNAGWLILKNDSGTYMSYPLTPTLPIFKNGRPCTAAEMLPGDRVKIMVQTDGENQDIASIDIEKVTRPVTGIYRGNFEYFDRMRDTLAVSGVEEFVNGKWERHPAIGIQNFTFNGDYGSRPTGRVWGKVFFATQKSLDGSDKIVAAAYRGSSGYETTIKDNVFNMSGDGLLALENSSDIIKFDENTIAIKDGRLVDIGVLETLDPVTVSMEKSLSGTEYIAQVVVSKTPISTGPVIYRGRIKSVESQKTVTVESFAQLNGVTWTFTNTPKTFDIDLSSSRLIESDGVGNLRDFGSGYVGQSVYIVATGSRINLISTAPYADSPASGRVGSLTGATFDSEGAALTEPTEMVLTNTMVYNTGTHQWNTSNPLTIAIPRHAVVVKNGMAGGASLIKPGDDIKVIRHSQSNEGILILCN